MLSCGINFEAGEMLWIVLGHDAATTMVDDEGSTTVDWLFFGGKFIARYPGFGRTFHGDGFLDPALYLTTFLVSTWMHARRGRISCICQTTWESTENPYPHDWKAR